MRRIAVSLSKGGVGKTSSAVSLSAGLALAGRRVLLVDTDTQGQCSKALGLSPAAGLAELAAGEVNAEEALTPARDNLWLLSGGRSLAGLSRLIARKDYQAERTLSEVLEPYSDRFDFIILDTAPGYDSLQVNVLFYAEEILSPISLEALTLAGLTDFSKTIDNIRRYRPELSLRYILPTFYDLRVRKSEEILEQLRRHFGERVCSPIRYSVRLSEAPGHGQHIFEYSPHSPAAEDYRALTSRILNNGHS